MSLALLFHYLLFNMFRMLVHSSSGACDLLWIYFDACWCWCYGVVRLGRCGILMQAEAVLLRMCVGILLWFDVCWRYGVVRLGWCGILMQAEALLPHPA